MGTLIDAVAEDGSTCAVVSSPPAPAPAAGADDVNKGISISTAGGPIWASARALPNNARSINPRAILR